MPTAEKIAFTLMWDSDLREQVNHLAAADDRSVSAVIRTALREHLARRLPQGPQTATRTFRTDALGPVDGQVVYSPVDGQSAA